MKTPLVTLLALSLAAGSAVAQLASDATPNSDSSGNEASVQLDTFRVVGSSIKRLDGEKVLPVTSLTLDQLNILDAAQPSDLFGALPMATGLPGNEAANATQNARGDNASVSFRGLPSGNTLILLNGRRMPAHPISQGEASIPALSVNVNTLPGGALTSIQVLRDGASSIYGSDAVAAVVNYQTNTYFRGTQLALSYSQTSENDGLTYRATLTHGREFANGKGRLVLTADFWDREALFQSQRSFSADGDHVGLAPAPWNVYTNTTFFGRTATSAYGQFALGSVTGTTQFGRPIFTPGRPAGIPSAYAANNGTFYLIPTTPERVNFGTAAPARAATGPGHDYYWNLSDNRLIQPKSTRGNVFVSGEYDLAGGMTLFTDLSVYKAESVSYRDPDVYTQSSNSDMVVPIDNPYNPFGSRYWSPTGAPNADGTPRLVGTPTAVNIISHRFADFGPRQADIKNDVYRGVFGLRGKVFDTWEWELGALLARTRGEDSEPAARISLLQAGLNSTNPATAINAFGRTFAVQNGAIVDTGPYVTPQSVKDSVYGTYLRIGHTGLRSIDFRASGDVWKLWGGNSIRAAFGAEHRHESYNDYRPPFVGLNPPNSGFDPTLTDYVSASSQPDTNAARDVTSVYAETVLPLAGGDFKLPLVHLLEVNAAVRFEHYTISGDSTNPKLGLNWKPASWLMVRASHNEGFRAPSLVSQFKGSYSGITLGSADTYRNTVTNLLTDTSANRNNLVTGNPNLKPETSKGKSVGIVIDVPKVKGLSLSADYWEIRQSDVIGSSGTVNDDRDALIAATQAALAAGKNINDIDLGSGTDNYLGDPSAVARYAVTADDRALFAAYNAGRAPDAQRAPVGAIKNLLTTYINRAERFVNGFDYNLNYRVPFKAWGNFTFDSTWTRMLTNNQRTSATGRPTNFFQSNTASAGGATPKWRGNATLSWRLKQWGAGVGAYYIGYYMDSGATTTQSVYDSLGAPSYLRPFVTAGSTSYRFVVADTISYNANVSYRFRVKNTWLNDTRLRLGVANLLNEEPPLTSDAAGYDAAVYNTLARGRTYTLTFTKNF